MTAYSAIADSEIDPESPFNTTLATKFRDNPIAIAEGASGAPAIQPQNLFLDEAAGTNRTLRIRTSGTERWIFFGTSTAETGSNAGTDFVLAAYNDAGSQIFTPISIIRSTGVVTIPSLNTTSTLNSIAGATLGAVGTYAWLGETTLTSTAPGGTQSGSNLRYAGISASSSWAGGTDRTINWGHGATSTSISGTWRCMGYSYSDTVNDFSATLWLRIS